ncbi:RHS repeat-associated core domain-containing protein, partial [Duganella sp. Root198D2]|uniref:RHS repeat-associated core domain-containing protein n=2 Tax=unclassified Duganella TaxID=2636909 RepID=UPI000AA2DF49
ATGQSANKFGYTGHQMDAETGLVYFQARYYDPQLGRFITQDPYEGDWNTPLSLHHYLYAYGNPTVYYDLNGYESISATIDNWAEGCGAWSCAGYAFMKGAAAGLTFGFTTVHDPVADQYYEGKITRKQYFGRGMGGGMAIVGINAASVFIGGGAGSTVTTTLGGQVLRSAAVGGVTAAGTDAATQSVNIAAGLQDHFDGKRTLTSGAIGLGVGVLAPVGVAASRTKMGQAVIGAVKDKVGQVANAMRKRQSAPPATKPPVAVKASTANQNENITVQESNDGAGRRVGKAGHEEAGTSQESVKADKRGEQKTPVITTADEPEVKEFVKEFEKKYPGRPYQSGHKRTHSDGRELEIDFETDNAIVEIKAGQGQGLSRQVKDRLDPSINPSGKVCIGLACDRKGFSIHAKKSVEKAGGLASDKMQEVIDVIAE